MQRLLRYSSTVLLTMLVLVAAYAPAQDNATAIATELSAKLIKQRTLVARYKQTEYFASKTQPPQQSAGKIWIKQPKYFRWQEDKPDRLIAVGNGVEVWLYDIDLEQITIYPFQQKLAQLVQVLLFDLQHDNTAANLARKLASVYTITKSAPLTYVLQPRAASGAPGTAQLQGIALSFNPKTDALQQMIMYNPGAQKVVLDFTAVNIGTDLPATLFILQPPKGVEVVRSSR